MNHFARTLLAALVLALASAGAALPDDGPPVRVGLDFFLPANTTYDAAIPKPAETLGYEVAEWHVRHDQLVRYMETLAQASPRVSMELQGRTHEGRPQVLLAITSVENQGRIEELRKLHLDGGDPDAQPAIVWLGYSIHGDEASGSNASMVVAYHLAAAQGEEIEGLLRNTIVLIDPSLNPDGLGRFAQWANGHRGLQPARDPAHREHRQVWPGGRVNHYWFDLNRDWLLLRHPESRNRVRTFHHWRPHLLGDFHEMGSNSTYFFQPGVPERKNPLIPDENQKLTQRIARYHADALDQAGELYFTEEAFDDFYPGKGSTYPDLNGSVGVLFEQASVRGHRQETINGTKVFADAVRNQFLTSLSMVKAAQALRPDLVSYQQGFVAKTREKGLRGDTAGWVFAAPEDPALIREVLELLRQHHIEVRHLGKTLRFGETTFEPDSAFFVPADQDAHLLSQALFETRTTFQASTFYDVSAWTLPLAFGVPSRPVLRKGFSAEIAGNPVSNPVSPPIEPPSGVATDSSSSDSRQVYAYLIDGGGYFSHRALRRLQEKGVRVRVASRPFEAKLGGDLHPFARGTLVVSSGGQPPEVDLEALMDTIRAEDSVPVRFVATGLTEGGVDLGSTTLSPLRKPRPVLLVGRGVDRYEAGEVWYLLDHRFGMELPMVDLHSLGELDLGAYTHLLMVNGRYDSIPKEADEEVRRWVRDGGVVVATRGAASWAQKKLLTPAESSDEAKKKAKEKKDEDEEKNETVKSGERENKPSRASGVYGEFEKERQAQRVSGAIFQAQLDLTHPLAFGYLQPQVALLRNSTKVLKPSENPYENVATYTSQPLLAGYSSPENLEKLAGTTALVAQRVGRGAVIRFADNPNFRAFWYGTTKLYLNAIFYSSAILETPPPKNW